MFAKNPLGYDCHKCQCHFLKSERVALDIASNLRLVKTNEKEKWDGLNRNPASPVGGGRCGRFVKGVHMLKLCTLFCLVLII